MNREKYVDESWKESVELQKDKLEDLAQQSKGKLHVKSSFDKGEENAAPSAQPSTASSAQSQPTKPQASQSTNETIPQFLNYLSSLAYQSLIFLGQIPHPATQMLEKDLDQAKFIIDTLVVLRDKTKGNLSKQEEDVLNGSIYELQMKYVEIMQQEAKIPGM